MTQQWDAEWQKYAKQISVKERKIDELSTNLNKDHKNIHASGTMGELVAKGGIYGQNKG